MAEILIADDDAQFRKLVHTLLDSEGHIVTEARDGNSALDVLNKQKFDLAILDVKMGNVSGFDVARALQAMETGTVKRILFLTAAVDEEDHLKGWTYGADGYIAKDFQADDLLEQVNAVLAMSEGELAKRREGEIERARLLRQLDRFLD